MDEMIRDELEAMQTAYTALQPLNEAGRRRAATWLVAKLGVDLSTYDLVDAEAAGQAETSML